MSALSSKDQLEKIWSLAKYVRVAMLTTWQGGDVTVRPMHSVIRDDEKFVWFITDRHSTKVHEAQQNSEAILTFSNGTGGDHLVMSGTLAVVDDRAKVKSLWNPGADLFFPSGPSDENAVLLRFAPIGAEYWTGGGGLLSFVVRFIEAKWTGERPRIGEHASARL